MAQKDAVQFGQKEVLVGQGAENQLKPTDVPGGASVSKAVVPQATGPSPAANSAPESLPSPDQMTFDNGTGGTDPGALPDPNEMTIMPDYADGTSPDRPINSSPLSTTERFLLGLGNKAGNYKWLKNKFGDVKMDEKGNFLVPKDGSWYRTDPSGAGDSDPWELTRKIVAAAAPGPVKSVLEASGFSKPIKSMDEAKAIGSELAGDAADVGGAGITVGASLLGGMVSKNPGAAIGGAAAGAGLGELARTSWGRLEGTYDATPQEQAKDIGMETLFGLAGGVVPVGARVTSKFVANKILNWAEKSTMSNAGKETLSLYLSSLAGTNKNSIRFALDNPSVIKEASAAVEIADKEAAIQLGKQRAVSMGPGFSAVQGSASAPPAQVKAVLGRQQMADVNKLSELAQEALSTQWERDTAEVLKNVPGNFVASPKAVVRDTMAQMEQMGLGKIVNDDAGRITFEKLSPNEMTTYFQKQGIPQQLQTDTMNALNDYTRTLEKYAKFPDMNGKVGAERLLQLKKELNRHYSGLYNKALPDAAEASITQLKKASEDSLSKAFTNPLTSTPKAAESYVKVASNYADFADEVKRLARATEGNSQDAVENYIKRAAGREDANLATHDQAERLAQLIKNGGSDEGYSLINSLRSKEAAKSFVDLSPTSLNGNSFQAALRTVGDMTKTGNPRVQASFIDYSHKALDFVRGAAMKNQSHQLSANDAILRTLLLGPAETAAQEEMMKQQLLQQSGAVPQGQGQ